MFLYKINSMIKAIFLQVMTKQSLTNILVRNIMYNGEDIKADDFLSRISVYAKLNNEHEGWTHTNFPYYIPEGKEQKYNTMMHQFYEYTIK